MSVGVDPETERLVEVTPAEEAPPVFMPQLDGGDAALRAMRARKFRALAALFRLELDDYPSAVQTLLEPCPGICDCTIVDDGAVHVSGVAARDWASGSESDESVRTEHVRLFGGPDRVKQMPVVSACGAAYMSEEYDGDPAVVAAIYSGIGFEPRLDGGSCPAHISNELDFMAYCLERGDRDALTVAHAFILTHLFSWGVVFAAAVFARSEHPMTRFAGTMLEHMLFCELEHARSYAGVYGFLRGSSVAS